jgi:hypothetical protein
MSSLTLVVATEIDVRAIVQLFQNDRIDRKIIAARQSLDLTGALEGRTHHDGLVIMLLIVADHQSARADDIHMQHKDM